MNVSFFFVFIARSAESQFSYQTWGTTVSVAGRGGPNSQYCHVLTVVLSCPHGLTFMLSWIVLRYYYFRLSCSYAKLTCCHKNCHVVPLRLSSSVLSCCLSQLLCVTNALIIVFHFIMLFLQSTLKCYNQGENSYFWHCWEYWKLEELINDNHITSNLLAEITTFANWYFS